MTGAPIYLVSACTSGEEFVAAFRRYADKNGLFVPISEPLPIGCRGRFAVALKDGGVMIEGEAEIINSARTASTLHGRVGMTLRFLQPDDASKTMLGELEKARLAMRPAPPSVSPRPAMIPAEPRPVPPPVQGRIDAVNALAECVAIGDLGALVPPAPPAIAAPPKAGPRFVVPVVPPAIAKPDDRKAVVPPSVTPRAAPPLEQPRKGLERRSDPAQAVPAISGFSTTMTAVAPLRDTGRMSDTFVAAAPPAPPRAGPPRAGPRCSSLDDTAPCRRDAGRAPASDHEAPAGATCARPDDLGHDERRAGREHGAALRADGGRRRARRPAAADRGRHGDAVA